MHPEEEAYRSLFERNIDGVFLLDQAGRFVAVNAAAERISGYRAEEVKERTFRDLCAADQLEKSEEAFRLALKGETHDLETAIIHKNGQRVDLHLVGGPVVIHGSVNGLFVILKDVTHRKGEEAVLRTDCEELEAQLQEQNSRLHDGIARRTIAEDHVRSITSALNMAEYREREKLAHILHDSLQQTLVSVKFHAMAIGTRDPGLLESVQEICGLIDEAIRTSRSLTAELSPPVLQSGLVPALEWLAVWVRQKLGLMVYLSISELPNTPTELRYFIFQAVRELLLNAAKHAGVRSARISVSVERQELQVAVEDDGAGFDPIRTQSDQAAGEGFGLVSIRERIALLGGRFEIESAPGMGSHFRLSLPFLPSPST
jgi:PAS domain S-box-containing protein